LATVAVCLVTLAAVAPTAQARRPVAPRKRWIGIGYKIGNSGLDSAWDLLGGDVFIRPAPHLALDLQGNYKAVGDTTGNFATGFSLAPEVSLELYPFGGTPYIALGALYERVSDFGGETASGTGFFFNTGYDYPLSPAISARLGFGIVHLPKLSFDLVGPIQTGGSTANVEAGVRYMF
jgi:hypothetical protein